MMSEKTKPDGKSSKPSKPLRLGTLVTAAGSKPKVPAFMPPVLRDVGKLAAGVASVSTLNSASGSATGNPRNKVVLQPGHSLMDWIRLGNSGKDLTRLGAAAGTLTVTRQELAKHNKQNDAWLAIRGKVYNVTEYFSFHPGGQEELMRGAGIDATKLFDQIHSWVNYEQILQKCLVGRLVSLDPKIDTEELFFGKDSSASSKSTNSALNTLKVSSADEFGASGKKQFQSKKVVDPLEHTITSLPRFDWIQKLDYITVIFYTKAFSNPLVEISTPVDEQTVLITLAYEESVFENELTFYQQVRWPCNVSVTAETGKVDIMFRKSDGGIWNNYGVLRQHIYSVNNISARQIKSSYILEKKNAINYNTWLLKFVREDGKNVIYPIGYHVRVMGKVNGEEMSRSYTPVPECLFETFVPNISNKKNNLCLMIKRYSDGIMSRFTTDRSIDDKVQITRPSGQFDLKMVQKKDSIIMLAAGTGITPMLGLILFFLERSIKKCQFVRLLFFNRTEKDILFRNQLEDLAQIDQRFKIDNILSDAQEAWDGLRGHVSADLVAKSIKEHLNETGYTIQEIFSFVCGPPKFNAAAVDILKSVTIMEDQVHVFEG